MNVLISKLYETILAVAPVTILVSILHFTVAPLGTEVFVRFILGATSIIAGLAIFLFGVDIAISPVGTALGSALARRKNIFLLIAAGLTLGFFINVAEPNLLVVAYQIRDVSGGLLGVLKILIVVSIGVGVMVAIGLVRIVMQVPLKNLLLGIYAIVALLGIFAPTEFLGIAMDAGGATTGSMTVPFILALGIGVSTVHAGPKAEEDSFGLTAVATSGPMITVLAMALISGLKSLSGKTEAVQAAPQGIIEPFFDAFGTVVQEVSMAISPIIILTLIAQVTLMHLPKRTFRRILKGFVYTYIGFIFFLTGVTAGFMDAGQLIGDLVAKQSSALAIAIGALIGLLVILAEPSVHVLTAQVEEASGGAIKRSAILITLAIGVSLAIALTIFRIVTPGVELWHLLLPGYAIAFILSRFTPPLLIGIAFDSACAASGPMTATFVLAFAQGTALAIGGSAGLVNAFGVIAMVALTPIIALQLFGLIYGRQERKYKERLASQARKE